MRRCFHFALLLLLVALGGVLSGSIIFPGWWNSARPTPSNSQQVLLVEIVENNHDSFPEPVRGPQYRTARPAFEVQQDRIVVRRSVADETDADKLREQGIVLGSAGTPLAKARVLVAYRTEFAEGGRRGGGQVQYYAFAQLPGRIEIPRAAVGDRLEHKLTRDGAFSLAVRKLRAFPENGEAIEIAEPQPNGDASVTFAGKTVVLPSGKPFELAQTSRTVAVVELPVTAERFHPRPGEAPVEVRPRKDHGNIRFTTTLTATAHGILPIQVGN